MIGLTLEAMTAQELEEEFKKSPQGAEFVRDLKAGKVDFREAAKILRDNWIAGLEPLIAEDVFFFETGKELNQVLKSIRKGSKIAAILLAKTIYPLPGSPGHEALEHIKSRYKHDIEFQAQLAKELKETMRREKMGSPRLRHTVLGEFYPYLFFWMQTNEDWLRRENVSSFEAWEAFLDWLGEFLQKTGGPDYADTYHELVDACNLDAFRKILSRTLEARKRGGRKRGKKTSKELMDEEYSQYVKDLVTEE